MNVFLARIIGFFVIGGAAWIMVSYDIAGSNVSPEQILLSTAFGFGIFLISLTAMELTQSAITKKSGTTRLMATTLARADTMRRLNSSSDVDRIRRKESIRELEAIMWKISGQSSGDRVADLRKKLMIAGYRSPNAVITYALLKIVVPLFGVMLGYFLGASFYGDDFTMMLVFIAALGLGSSILVDKRLDSAVKARLEKVEVEFPVYLEILLICVRSGMTIDRAIELVNKELQLNSSDVEILHDFEILASELKILSDRIKPFENLEARLPSPSVSSFTMMMVQSERYGTPISKAISELAEQVRKTTLVNAEKKAAKLPVIMLFPMMVFIILPLLVLIMGPAGIRIMDSLL